MRTDQCDLLRTDWLQTLRAQVTNCSSLDVNDAIAWFARVQNSSSVHFRQVYYAPVILE